MKITSAVKNPLTIIAIFAGLAEVAGTVVLPFVAAANQLTYIWFLMVFPTLLILLFFFTLNWNPKVLYAPSDFRDESNYMEIFRPSSTAERLVKLEEEVQETVIDETSIKNNSTAADYLPHLEPVSLPKLRIFERLSNDRRGRYMLAENLIIDRLSAEFKMPAQRELALSQRFGKGYLFDAVFEDKRGPIIVEIKLLPEMNISRRMRETLHKMEQAVSSMPESMRHSARVLLVFVHEAPTKNIDQIKSDLNRITSSFPVPIELRIYDLKELIAEAEM